MAERQIDAIKVGLGVDMGSLDADLNRVRTKIDQTLGTGGRFPKTRTVKIRFEVERGADLKQLVSDVEGEFDKIQNDLNQKGDFKITPKFTVTSEGARQMLEALQTEVTAGQAIEVKVKAVWENGGPGAPPAGGTPPAPGTPPGGAPPAAPSTGGRGGRRAAQQQQTTTAPPAAPAGPARDARGRWVGRASGSTAAPPAAAPPSQPAPPAQPAPPSEPAPAATAARPAAPAPTATGTRPSSTRRAARGTAGARHGVAIAVAPPPAAQIVPPNVTIVPQEPADRVAIDTLGKRGVEIENDISALPVSHRPKPPQLFGIVGGGKRLTADEYAALTSPEAMKRRADARAAFEAERQASRQRASKRLREGQRPANYDKMTPWEQWRADEEIRAYQRWQAAWGGVSWTPGTNIPDVSSLKAIDPDLGDAYEAYLLGDFQTARDKASGAYDKIMRPIRTDGGRPLSKSEKQLNKAKQRLRNALDPVHGKIEKARPDDLMFVGAAQGLKHLAQSALDPGHVNVLKGGRPASNVQELGKYLATLKKLHPTLYEGYGKGPNINEEEGTSPFGMFRGGPIGTPRFGGGSIRDVEKELRQILPNAHIDLSKFREEHARDLLGGAKALAADYPNTAARIQAVYPQILAPTTIARTGTPGEEMLNYLQEKGDLPKWLAPNDPFMQFNPLWSKNPNAAGAFFESGGISLDYGDVFTHEFAHAINQTAGNPLIKQMARNGTFQVSPYSYKNSSEASAEAFTLLRRYPDAWSQVTSHGTFAPTQDMTQFQQVAQRVSDWQTGKIGHGRWAGGPIAMGSGGRLLKTNKGTQFRLRERIDPNVSTKAYAKEFWAEHPTSGESMGGVTVYHDADGNPVDLYPHIKPGYQRRGLASKIYAELERKGIPVESMSDENALGGHQTEMGSAFWQARKRRQGWTDQDITDYYETGEPPPDRYGPWGGVWQQPPKIKIKGRAPGGPVAGLLGPGRSPMGLLGPGAMTAADWAQVVDKKWPKKGITVKEAKQALVAQLQGGLHSLWKSKVTPGTVADVNGPVWQANFMKKHGFHDKGPAISHIPSHESSYITYGKPAPLFQPPKPAIVFKPTLWTPTSDEQKKLITDNLVAMWGQGHPDEIGNNIPGIPDQWIHKSIQNGWLPPNYNHDPEEFFATIATAAPHTLTYNPFVEEEEETPNPFLQDEDWVDPWERRRDRLDRLAYMLTGTKNWQPRDPQRMAISNYTGSGHYSINQWLRGFSDPQGLGSEHFEKLIARRNLLDSTMRPLRRTALLYRHQPVEPILHQLGKSSLEIGDEWVDPGFVSTKLDFADEWNKRAAETARATQFVPTKMHWAGADPTMGREETFRIRAMRGTPAAWLRPYSSFDEEDEMLLGRGRKFKVTGIGILPSAGPYPEDRNRAAIDVEARWGGGPTGELERLPTWLGGSTGAWLGRDPAGTKFVVKPGGSPGQSLDELVADNAYRTLGFPMPYSAPYKGNQKISQFLSGPTLREFMETAAPAARKAMLDKVRQGFAADALLANWDALGLNMENIVIHNGEPYRIDTGGALRYRGMGGLKGSAFGPSMTEDFSMRDPSYNRLNARVYGALNDEQVAKQFGDIWSKKEELLKVFPPELQGIMAARLGKYARWSGGMASAFESLPITGPDEADRLLQEAFPNAMIDVGHQALPAYVKSIVRAALPLAAEYPATAAAMASLTVNKLNPLSVPMGVDPASVLGMAQMAREPWQKLMLENQYGREIPLNRPWIELNKFFATHPGTEPLLRNDLLTGGGFAGNYGDVFTHEFGHTLDYMNADALSKLVEGARGEIDPHFLTTDYSYAGSRETAAELFTLRHRFGQEWGDLIAGKKPFPSMMLGPQAAIMAEQTFNDVWATEAFNSRRAAGGPVYHIGERGPERFVGADGSMATIGQFGDQYMRFDRPGWIIPNHMMGMPISEALQRIPQRAGGGPTDPLPGETREMLAMAGIRRVGTGPNERFYAGHSFIDRAQAHALIGQAYAKVGIQRVFVVNWPVNARAVAQGTAGQLLSATGQPISQLGGPPPPTPPPTAPGPGPAPGKATATLRPGVTGITPLEQVQASQYGSRAVQGFREQIGQARIATSEALQFAPVRALSVSLGQIAQNAIGGRGGILERARQAQYAANTAERTAGKLDALQAQQRANVSRVATLRNLPERTAGEEEELKRLTEKGGTMTQLGEAIRARTKETATAAAEAEIRGKGLGKAVSDMEENLDLPGAVRKQRVEFLRSVAETLPEKVRGGVTTRFDTFKSQATGIVGIVGGTMLFSAAMQVAQAGMEAFGKVLGPAVDALQGWTRTMIAQRQELTQAVAQRPGTPEAALAGRYAQLGLSPQEAAALGPLGRQAQLMAAAQNAIAVRDLQRAADAARGLSNLRVPGLGVGFGNGPLAGTPLDWMGQTQGAAEVVQGRVADLLPKNLPPVQPTIGNITQGLVDAANPPPGYVWTDAGMVRMENGKVVGEPNNPALKPAQDYLQQLVVNSNKGLGLQQDQLKLISTSTPTGAMLAQATKDAFTAIGAPDLGNQIVQAGLALQAPGGGGPTGATANLFLRGYLQNQLRPNPQELLASMQPQITAQFRDIERRANTQATVVAPVQTYQRYLQQPISPYFQSAAAMPSSSASIFGGGISGLSAGQTQMVNQYADAWKSVAEAQRITQEQGRATLLALGVPPQVLSQLDALEQKYQDIADGQRLITVEGQRLQGESRSHGLDIQYRQLSDLVGLTGQNAVNLKLLDSYGEDGTRNYINQTIQASKLGDLQHAQLMDTRELARLQLVQQGRQLNFQKAMLNFTYEGRTPGEAASYYNNQRELIHEQERAYNITKRSTNRGFTIEDLQNTISLADASAAYQEAKAQETYDYWSRSKTEQLDAERQIADTQMSYLQPSIDAALQRKQAEDSILASMENELGPLNDQLAIMEQIYRYRVGIQTGVLPDIQIPEHGVGSAYASGAWNIPRDMAARLHRGEMVLPASTAAALRRYQDYGASTSSMGMGGGTTISVTFTGDITVRDTQDIDRIASRVEERLNRKVLAGGFLS